MSEQALRGWYWAGVIVFVLAIWVMSNAMLFRTRYAEG
jgi:hypothetical protein